MHLLPPKMTNSVTIESDSQSGSPRRRGALLINLGTPDQPDVRAVRQYLAEFLSDPAVIRLPTGFGWLNGFLGRLIARFRAPRSTRMYGNIWTDRGSPLKTITEDQVSALEAMLPRGWRVFYAMRYGRPAIVETLRRIEAAGIDELVVLPMYPQFSGPTTGTALRLVYDYLKNENHRLHVTVRTTWYDDHGYVNAQAKLLKTYAESNGLTPDNTYLLFSTHGLPVSYVIRGDPYPEHVTRTVGLVRQRLGWPADRTSLAYQSRLGPVEWLQPYTDRRLQDLARAGEKKILVCPISFTADCLETLEEINVHYRELLEQMDAELYLCPALNTYGPFISALKHLVLAGPRPITGRVEEMRSFQATEHNIMPVDAEIDSLVMIGVSMRGRLGPGRGPQLAYTDIAGLRRAKRSQYEVPDLLRTIHQRADVREAWVLNTCYRFEFYSWFDRSDGKRADPVTQIRHLLFPDAEATGLNVNVLHGADAWHHLLRTTAGLNSALPGERDIRQQLQAAHRLASRAGTAGRLTERLVADVLALERDLRKSSEWNRYHPDYSLAALSHIAASTHLDLHSCRIVVIGGSTTSAAVLRTLIERFKVPSRQLTLLYRGHKRGGQMKILRQAIGRGRRLRVQSYAEPCVLDAVADADVVVFGVDRHEPVLEAERIAGRRDWMMRPLTIFDFNMFGSTTGMDTLSGVKVYDANRLEAEVTAYADELCETEAFARAMNAAESWIVENALTNSECDIVDPHLRYSTPMMRSKLS